MLGAVVLGFDGLGDDGFGDDGGGTRLPGLFLCAGAVGGGFALLRRFGHGPLATAGTVAATLGVPAFVLFLTWDGDRFPPYSADAVLFVSTAAWLGAWLAGPARGRPFLLGAGCVGAWALALQVTEDVFELPFDLFRLQVPDLTTVAGISLLFAAAYHVVGRRLDHAGADAAATPVLVAALVCTLAGVVSLAQELEPAGAGFVGAVVGAAVVVSGASMGRRGTTWAGAVAVLAGCTVLLVDALDDAVAIGLLAIALGGAVVFVADRYATAAGEPTELPSP